MVEAGGCRLTCWVLAWACVRAQNIQTLVIAAATRRLGWKSVAVLREGWGKAFVDQLLMLKVGIVSEVVRRPRAGGKHRQQIVG